MAKNLPKQLQNGLVLWLDGAGKDLSGNANNGTLINSPTKVRVLQNDGLTYNGSNQYITTSLPAAMTTMTDSVWINTNGGNTMIVSDDQSNNRNGCMYFSAGNNTLNYIFNNGSSYINVASTITLTNNVWYNAVGVYDGSAIRIYINGVLNNSTAASWTPQNVWAYYQLAAQAGITNFNWKIINPMRWNRALSTKEIEMLYVSTFIK